MGHKPLKNSMPPINEEPVAYAGVVLAIANLLAQLLAKHGVNVDATTIASLITSALTVGTAFYVRSRVHANPKVARMVAAAAAGTTHITIPPKGSP
jgi:hypothetical protein